MTEVREISFRGCGLELVDSALSHLGHLLTRLGEPGAGERGTLTRDHCDIVKTHYFYRIMCEVSQNKKVGLA